MIDTEPCRTCGEPVRERRVSVTERSITEVAQSEHVQRECTNPKCRTNGPPSERSVDDVV